MFRNICGRRIARSHLVRKPILEEHRVNPVPGQQVGRVSAVLLANGRLLRAADIVERKVEQQRFD
jgi:hypothetical protein